LILTGPIILSHRRPDLTDHPRFKTNAVLTQNAGEPIAIIENWHQAQEIDEIALRRPDDNRLRKNWFT
jgi:hypothetical protein